LFSSSSRLPFSYSDSPISTFTSVHILGHPISLARCTRGNFRALAFQWLQIINKSPWKIWIFL
jgi:hypothetical protein